MIKTLIALGGLGWLVWRANAQRRRHGDHLDAAGPQASAAPNRGPLNVWENEGGALHASGPQIGPEPTPAVLGEEPEKERQPV